MMDAGFVFLLMMAIHVIEDFHLQGRMADMKQQAWWEEFPDRYRMDYTMVLFLHGLEWSVLVSLPLLLITGLDVPMWLVPAIVINGFIHSVVDDLKANRFKINLIQDQLIHMVQMASILALTLVIA